MLAYSFIVVHIPIFHLISAFMTLKYPALFNCLKLVPMVEDPKKKVKDNFAAVFYKFHKLGERERSK